MTYASDFTGSAKNSVRQLEPGQPVTQNSAVLFDPVLDNLRAVAHVAQVPVDPADQAVASVAELAPHRKKAHRRPAIERLEPRGAVGVAEHVRADPASRVRRSPRLAWDALIELYGDEAVLRERIESLKATRPQGADDLLELADKYLSGWHPDASDDD